MQQCLRILPYALISAAIGVAVSGCMLANYVKPAKLTSDASATQVVLGLDATRGPVRVALVRYDPKTGETGSCQRFDRAEASLDEGRDYFIFDVRPGLYVASNWGIPFGRSVTFAVPRGQRVYAATFASALRREDGDLVANDRAPFFMRRDLAAVRAGVADARSSISLSETSPAMVNLRPFLCTP
jgi:hypothetical protein